MRKICLLPIYRRSYEENEKEREKALKEIPKLWISKPAIEIGFDMTNDFSIKFSDLFMFMLTTYLI